MPKHLQLNDESSTTLLLNSAIKKSFPSLLPSLEDLGSDVALKANLKGDLRSFAHPFEENIGIVPYGGK
jgi:hypothetical protein